MTAFVNVPAPVNRREHLACSGFIPSSCRRRPTALRLTSCTTRLCAKLPTPGGPPHSHPATPLDQLPALPDDAPPVQPHPEPPPPGLAATSAPLNPQVLFGEFLSTFLLVFLSLKLNAGPSAGPIPNAAVITVLAASFIPISGAHFNPAVTIALMVTNRVPVKRALAFIGVQLAASIAAALVAIAFAAPLAPPIIEAASNVALARAIASEFIPMFFIVCVVFLTAVATPREGGVGLAIAPFYIGLAVFTSIVAFPTATFNPARAFGPALLGNAAPFDWILWVPPILGAITAALMCEHVFLAKAAKRPPNSWLVWVTKKCSGMTDRVKTLGVAGLVSYGILNTLYYAGTFTVFMIRIGWSAGAAGLAQAWFVTWSLSQVTKPLRLGMSIFLAPFVDKWLTSFKRKPKSIK